MRSKRLIGGVWALTLASSRVYAGGFESPGVGAKAIAMGGAFVAVSDDWTATYWNPAGLAQLQGTGIGTAVNPLFSSDSDGSGLANPSPPFTKQNIDHGDVFINLGGEPSHFNETTSHLNVVLPASGFYHRWGNWVGAFSIHSPLGFSESVSDSSVPGLAVNFHSAGYTIMSGFSVATECLPDLYAGGGFHILTGELQRDAVKTGPDYVYASTADGKDNVTPEGVVVLLYRVHPKVRLGAVYRTPATLHLNGQATVSDTRFRPTTPGSPFQDESSHYVQDLYIPATYGVGVAYEPTSQWLVSADWQGTDWGPTRTKIIFDNPGVILQNQDFDAGWKFSNRFRLGGEYRATPKWAYRAGVSRDPQSLPDDAQSLTNLIDITRYFFALGFGWTSSPSLSLNVAYNFGYGQKNIDGVEYVRRSHSIIFDTVFRFL